VLCLAQRGVLDMPSREQDDKPALTNGVDAAAHKKPKRDETKDAETPTETSETGNTTQPPEVKEEDGAPKPKWVNLGEGAAEKETLSSTTPPVTKTEGSSEGEGAKTTAKQSVESAPPIALKPLPRLKVAYFHDPELAIFGHPREHMFSPFRGKLAHSLMCSYGFYPSALEPLHPRLVTRTDLGQFHSDAYLEILATAQRRANKQFSWKEGAANEDEDPDVKAKVDEVLKRFNVVLDPKKSVNAVFPGIFDYCRLYTTGTLGCAARLCNGDANLAINWYGGMCHARSSLASYGCFVNDSVLGTLELLQQFQRVLFINLSGIHADAVEQAFYTTSRVMFVSFHLKPDMEDTESVFPGTGNVADTGVDDGDRFTVNVPLEPGIDDESFLPLFRGIIHKARNQYSPQAVVLQCGGGLLAGERDGLFNLSSSGYGECVRIVRDFELPLLMLGGNGANLANVGRLWAYLTSVALGLEYNIPKEVPESTEYREYFGPNYKTSIPKLDLPEVVDKKGVQVLLRKVQHNLQQIGKR